MVLAVVREQEAQDPLIFGENGAGSRAFALAEMAFTLGIMLGPLLSGPLVELVGYFYMNVVFGKFLVLLFIHCRSANFPFRNSMSYACSVFIQFPSSQTTRYSRVVLADTRSRMQLIIWSCLPQTPL